MHLKIIYILKADILLITLPW